MQGDFHIPEDIIEMVISKMPGRSILKFKILSKKWKETISLCHHFRSKKNNESIKNPYLLCLDHKRTGGAGNNRHVLITSRSTDGEVLDKWDLGDVLQYPKMLHSPWGLHNIVCLVMGFTRFTACNPTTRSMYTMESYSFPGLITAAGFDFVSTQNCYTIVCQTGDGIWKKLDFHKDPSSSNGFNCGAWNIIDGGDPPPHLVDEMRWAVAAKGILYWTRSTHQDPLLVCFDLSAGRFFTVSMPDEIKGPESNGVYSILEMNEDLYLTYWRVGESMIELWRLDDPTKQIWTKNLIRLTGFHKSFGSHFRPLKVVDRKMLIHSGDFLDWYEMKNGVYRKMRNQSIKVPDNSGITDFQLYVDAPFG